MSTDRKRFTRKRFGLLTQFAAPVAGPGSPIHGAILARRWFVPETRGM